MSQLLQISADGGLYVQCEQGAEEQCSDAEVLKVCQGKRVCVVFADVAYASDLFPVSLSRRAERKLMAEARFKELAGGRALGSWCVIPHEQGRFLYLIAVDPECPAYVRLMTLMAAGLNVAHVSSELLLEAVPSAFSASACLLRVRRRGESLQLALRLHGHWVFARRVDLVSESPTDILASTLQYLISQKYCVLGQAIDWDIPQGQFSEGAFDAIKAEGDAVVYRSEEKMSFDCHDFRSSAHNCFNRVSQLTALNTSARLRPAMKAACAVALLSVTALLPAALLRAVPINGIGSTEAVDSLSPLHQSRFAAQQFFQQNPPFQLESVLLISQVLSKLLSADEHFDLLGLYVDGPFAMRLHCRSTTVWRDPLLRQRRLAELRTALQAGLGNASIRLVDAGTLKVGGSDAPRVLEFLLEVQHAPD